MFRILTCILASAVLAQAGVVIEQETQSGERTFGTTVIKVEGDKMRIELPASSGRKATYLVDLKAKSTTEILGDGRFAMLLPLKANADASKLTATGERQKVGDWSTQKYIGTGEFKNIAVWMSPDLPDANVAREALAPFFAAGAPTGNYGLNWTGAPGFPVKAEAILPSGKRIITIKSVTVRPLAESEFELPPGCTIMNALPAPR